MSLVLLVDNYDSFTWNLWHAMVAVPGQQVEVIRHDEARLSGSLDHFDKIVFSPGPGLPQEAGLMMNVISRYAGRKPLLGVCLGHQAMALHYGALLRNLEMPMHGIQRHCQVLKQNPLFTGLPDSFLIGHYHSWVVDEARVPETLEVTAIGEGGLIMGIRHTGHPSYGLQFHPESVMTPFGGEIIRNFLDL